MKPFEKVKNSSRSLFCFDHGLGDFVLYLPVHKEFIRQVGKRVDLASPMKRQFHKIEPSVISYESLDPKGYEYTYRIYYPDSKAHKPPFEYHDEPAKPYLCAYYELGMNEFTWKPHNIKNTTFVENSKRIGVHFFGFTGSEEKFCPKYIAEMIWNEIIEAGYEPFECHMRPSFRNDYKDCGDDDCKFIDENHSLRYQKPDINLMKNEIGKCKYFISVDSGPLYLAASLLGYDKIIGLEKLKRISYFCPKPFQKVSVREYQRGTIYKLIKRKEDAHV
jgi:hypothetical protein